MRSHITPGALFPAHFERNPTAQLFHVSPGTDAVQDAIDACVDDNGDVVVVGPGTHTVTETVALNKRGVTLVAAHTGYQPGAQGERFTIRADAGFTDGPVATISRPTSILGLGFWGREAAGASVAMVFGSGGFDSGGWSLLRHCWFPNHGEIARGLDLASVDRVRVEGCVFDGSNNGALSAGGKRLTAAIRMTQGHNVEVVGNEFVNALTAIDLALIAPKSDPVHGNVGTTIAGNRMLAVPATHFFLDVEDDANVRPQTVLVADNFLGVALASEAYKLGGAAQADLAALVTAGLQFAGNRYLDA